MSSDPSTPQDNAPVSKIRVLGNRLTGPLLILLVLAGLAIAAWPWRNYVVPLKIGIEGSYPPFTKTEADGSVTGLEIDWANQFCARMRARCELVKTDFDALIPQLQAGKLDAVMASLTVTEKRLKDVDFSDTYYNVPSAWIARTGSVASILPGEVMDSKTVAVLKGSPRDGWLLLNYPKMQRVAVAKEAETYVQLVDKKADLAFTSLLVAKTKFLNLPEGKDFAVVGNPVWLGNGVGVAVQKGDDSLRRRFNRAIAESIDAGEYKTTAARYVDFDLKERK